MANELHEKFITPEGILSYVHIWEKSKMPNDTYAYSLAFLIPESDQESIKKIAAAIKSAAVAKWGADQKKWPKPSKDKVFDKRLWSTNDSDNHPDGYVYFNCKNEKPVGVVGPNGRTMTDQDQLYSGCKGRLCVTFRAYAHKSGSVGVGAYINAVMKTADGDRLDGGVDAENTFSKYAVKDEDDAEALFNGTSEDAKEPEPETEDSLDSFLD